MASLPTYFKRANSIKLSAPKGGYSDYIDTGLNFLGLYKIRLEFSLYDDTIGGTFHILSADKTKSFILLLQSYVGDFYYIGIKSSEQEDPTYLGTIKKDRKIIIELEQTGDNYNIRISSDTFINDSLDSFTEYYGEIGFAQADISTASNLCIGKVFDDSVVDTLSCPINIYNFKVEYYESSKNLISKEFVPGAVYYDTQFGCYALVDKSYIGEYDSDYNLNEFNGTYLDRLNVQSYNDGADVSSTADFSLDLESATSLTINEGSVSKLQDKDGQILWEAAKHKYKNAYGIRWKNSDVTKVERVGNMNLHKTLPIQTRFKTCCYNHIYGEVLYADPNDRRFVTGADDYSFYAPKAYKVIPNTEYTSTKYYTPFGKPQYIVPLYSGFDGEEGMYLYNYIRVIDEDGHKVVFYVQGVDAENKYLICYYIEGDKTNTNIFNTSTVSTQAGEAPIASLTVELGFPINGCFGTVMVDTGGSFYLWSEEAATDNDYNYVWISEEKPEGVDAQYNPRTLVSADTVAIKSGEIKASDKNGNVPNDNWGYLGLLDDGASICCRNFSPELRGGDGNVNADLMLQPIESGKQPMDYFIALTRQGKPKGSIQKTACDAANELNDMTGMTYATYKGIFWLEAIEYASFRYTQDFKDPKNGLKQGGLRKNVITNIIEKTGKDWLIFNNSVPLNICLSSFDIGAEDCKTVNGNIHSYRNDGICYTKTDRYTLPTSYRGIEWRFNDRRTFLSDITTSTHITYTYYSEPKKQLTETVNCHLNEISSGYYSTFMLGNKADIFPKASSIGVTEEKCIGSHDMNTTEGYFVVGFILEPLSTFYRDVTGSDIFVNPNLGTVQQIVIG